MLLNTADAVYIGDVAADKVYLGDVLVWEPPSTGEWGPDERMMLDTPPTQGTGGNYTFGSRFDVLVPGRITHIRWWSQNSTQTNKVLSIWDASSRAKLATVTDPGPGWGWREMPLSPPLLVEPDTYVVSRHETVDYNYDYTIAHTPDSPNLGEPRAFYAPGGSGETFPDGDAGAGVCYFIDVVYQKGSESTALPYSEQVMSLNPLAYWRVNELFGTLAVDQMGAHDAEYVAAPHMGKPGLLVGDTDTAIELLGPYGGQGLRIANRAAFQLEVLTVEAWIKTANAGNSLRSILVKQNAYGLFTMDNCLCAYEWNGGGFINSYVNVADGLPHHVVAVFNGAASQVYLDGVAVGPVFTHSTLNQSANFCVGFNDYPSQEFIGIVDEPAIYARALTAAEVAANYQAGTAPGGGGEWTPADIPGLMTWIDPAQDMFTEGERVATYTDHAGGHVFLPDSRPEYQPIFHTAPPRLEFPNPSFGLYTTDVNLGPDGLTFVFVAQALDTIDYPMMIVSGPDADGWEMRHDSAATQIVERYATHSMVFLNHEPGLGTTGIDVRILRVAAGVRTDVWVNDALQQFAAAAAHNVPHPLYIARRQGGYYWRGSVHEALVYTGPVSDTDLALLRDYLTTKHGL